MRDWCKHKFGYVNFDDTHLYFTSTGNWSDTTDLGEFNEEVRRKSSSSELYKTMSYLSFALIILVSVLWAVGFTSFGYASIFGIVWLAYSAYHYFSPGLSKEFKIPYLKITNMEIIDSIVKIEFIDSNQEKNTQEIAGLDNKGVDLFLRVSIPN